jgi:hypothetical protein
MDIIKIKPSYNKITELTRNYTCLGGGILVASTTTPIYSYFSQGKLTEPMMIGSLILGGIGCSLLAKGLNTYFTYKNTFLEINPKEKAFNGKSIDNLTEQKGNYQELTLQNPYTKNDYGTIEVKLKNSEENPNHRYHTFTIPLVRNPKEILNKIKPYQ